MDEFQAAWARAEAAVQLDKLRRLGDLYFIQCGEFVKIGRTTNIVSRLTNMQTNSPYSINCLALLADRGFEESLWHEAFCDDRERGEWYRSSEQLDEAIELARAGKEWWDHLTLPSCVEGDPDDGDDIVDWHISLTLRRAVHAEQLADAERRSEFPTPTRTARNLHPLPASASGGRL